MTARNFFLTWVFYLVYAPEGAGKCRMYELYVLMYDCFVPARSFSMVLI